MGSVFAEKIFVDYLGVVPVEFSYFCLVKKTLIYYYVPYAVLLVAMLAALSVYPKAELHLWLNSCHTPLGDTFLRLYSQLAEWPLYVIAALPLVFKRWRLTVWYAASELVSATIVWVLKQLFHAPRPAAYFENIPDAVLPVVEGVRLHHSNSFPSGHTATFFVLFTFCALLLAHYYTTHESDRRFSATWRRLAMLLLLVMAALGGYSRIYLSQHFLSDVCVGSLIGVIVPTVIFALFSNRITRPNR